MIKHLACIMDGNRRWAYKQGWKAVYGHRKGIETIDCVIKFCLEKNISYLSLYAFSIENLKRAEDEKNSLFSLVLDEAQHMLDDCLKRNIKVTFIGDRSLFPATLVPLCQDIERKTHACSGLQLNFLFCYGGRQEIVGSIQQILNKVQHGLLQQHEITEETIRQHLWTTGIPEPELIIRTGGFKRLSNFLLYQSAYSEFYFFDCLWPELTTADLEKALEHFQQCQRNFGS